MERKEYGSRLCVTGSVNYNIRHRYPVSAWKVDIKDEVNPNQAEEVDKLYSNKLYGGYDTGDKE
jgi:hypothetical protein